MNIYNKYIFVIFFKLLDLFKIFYHFYVSKLINQNKIYSKKFFILI